MQGDPRGEFPRKSIAKNLQDQENLNQYMNPDIQQETAIDQPIPEQPAIPPGNIIEDLGQILELIQKVIRSGHQ